jgi:hypothetical protein
MDPNSSLSSFSVKVPLSGTLDNFSFSSSTYFLKVSLKASCFTASRHNSAVLVRQGHS